MATVELHSWKGEPAVTLRADEYEATFLPACGMLCTSLRHRGEEYVAWPRSLADFRAGSMTAIPLVHPWGNRLGGWEYRVGRKHVDLRGLRSPTTATASRSTATCARRRSRSSGSNRAGCTRGSTTARIPTSSRRSRSRTRSTVDARLDERGLRLTTIVDADDSDRGADLVLLAPVSATARRSARRLGVAVAEVRARRSRRAHHPDRRAHAAAGRTRADRTTARSTITTRSAGTDASRSRPPGARCTLTLRRQLSVRPAVRAAAAANSSRSSR